MSDDRLFSEMPAPNPHPNSDLDILARVRIVLVEPAGPLNIGAIARVMKNMGLFQLLLVNPRCNPTDEAALRMAVHATDVLETARQVDSLETALLDCRGIAGTVGRTQPMEFALEEPRTLLPQLLRPENSPCALVFGPEDRGLNNRELGMCQQQICIPTAEVYPSLNLAQAVGICVYEMRQSAIADATGRTRAANKFGSSGRAPSQVLEGFYQQLEQVLLQIGFFYPHTAPKKLLKFRRLFDRAQLTLKEVAMLRGGLTAISLGRPQHCPKARLPR